MGRTARVEGTTSYDDLDVAVTTVVGHRLRICEVLSWKIIVSGTLYTYSEQTEMRKGKE